MKVIVSPQGEIHAVWNDQLNAIPGHKIMERASNVEFNHVKQEWEARLPNGELIAHGHHRDALIAEEVKVVEKLLAQRLAA